MALIMKMRYICCLLLFVGCEGEKAKSKDVVLAFAQSKKYRYVTRMVDVPAAAMNRLAILEEHRVDICDSATKRHINLTDNITFSDECYTVLHFALIADTACLFAYRQGGIGEYDVVYYIKYKGNYLYAKYIPSNALVVDTAQLMAFLRTKPMPENDSGIANNNAENESVIKLSPPPPWPKKLNN